MTERTPYVPGAAAPFPREAPRSKRSPTASPDRPGGRVESDTIHRRVQLDFQITGFSNLPVHSNTISIHSSKHPVHSSNFR